MTFQRKIASLAVGAIAAVGVLGLASPAQAGSTAACTKGMACMWNDKGYSGKFYNFTDRIDFPAVLSSANDEATSIFNNGKSGYRSQAFYYADRNYTGEVRVLYDTASGSTYMDPDLTDGTALNRGYFNDVISSAIFK